MILLDVIIAGLLAITSSYCWRLNRKIAGFRNAKAELEHMIRSFDGSIRQAYESISILKENSSDKNIQLIRDMEKVRFLANDLAYLVEKGEKLADSLENQVRRPAPAAVELPTPQARPARPQLTRPAAQVRRPQPQFEQESQPRIAEVRNLIDTLARSYVVDQPPAPPSLPPRAAQARSNNNKASATPEQRAQAIEKVLNHMATQNQRGTATMPAIPPREMTQKVAASPRPVAAAAVPTNKRFFDTLRVVTPDE